MIFALAGNQNSGKTTLFNQLTGSNQHVGNFPGVTVEQKAGALRGEKEVQVVDLPGIYSLSPYTSEEIVTRDFLLSGQADGILSLIHIFPAPPLRSGTQSGWRNSVPQPELHSGYIRSRHSRDVYKRQATGLSSSE